MTAGDAGYVPGTAVVLLGPTSVALLDGDVTADRITRLWAAITAGAGIDRLVEALTADGLARLPGFGLAVLEPSGLRVLVRPGVVLIAEDDLGRFSRVETMTATTWVEQVMDLPVRVRLTRLDPPEESAELPLISGVVRASSVWWRPSPAPVEARSMTGSSADPAEPAQPVRSTPVTPVTPVDLPAGSRAVADTLPPSWTADVSHDEQPEQDRAVTSGYDHLFERTTTRTVAGAAMPPSAESDEGLGEGLQRQGRTAAGVAGVLDDVPLSSGTRAESSPPIVRGKAPARGGPLIDGVPLTPPGGVVTQTPVAPPSASAAPVSRVDDMIGETTSIEEIRRLAGAGARSGLGPNPAQVQAILCPRSHPNPVQADHCRDCGAALTFTEPVLVPRPVLGRLRFSTGQDVVLDRPLVVGRAPRADRVSGADIPCPVPLTGHGQDISRNHLEVRLEGWHVLVVDLGSRNGTLVALPGRPPELLEPRQPCLISPGTVVTLADDVTFRYETTL